MTGPPYPHPNPAPGSNAIGSFAIGVSPVGDIPPWDPWITIISQYANSPNITGMLLAFNAAWDQTQNFSNLYDFIWNVYTATGYGLDVWGRIVGVSRTVQLPGGGSYFGFDEATGSWTGFGQGSFYTGGNITNNFNLNDTDFRQLILAKAASNICNGSITATNAILLALFPGQLAYVQDNLNMSITYVFDFTPSAVQQAVVEQSGVLPSPCGVVINYQFA